MKQKALIFLIAVWLLTVPACGGSVGSTATLEPTETAPAQPAGGSIVVNVTMAKGVQGDQSEPVNPTDVFTPNDKTIHAVVQIQDAPADTKFTAAWYTTDVGQAAAPETLIDQTDIVTDGTRNVDFTLTTQETWPVGTYRVDISVNSEKVKTVPFGVKEP